MLHYALCLFSSILDNPAIKFVNPKKRTTLISKPLSAPDVQVPSPGPVRKRVLHSCSGFNASVDATPPKTRASEERKKTEAPTIAVLTAAYADLEKKE